MIFGTETATTPPLEENIDLYFYDDPDGVFFLGQTEIFGMWRLWTFYGPVHYLTNKARFPFGRHVHEYFEFFRSVGCVRKVMALSLIHI